MKPYTCCIVLVLLASCKATPCDQCEEDYCGTAKKKSESECLACVAAHPRFENTTHCGQNCATKAKTWCGGGPTPGPAPGPSPSGCETRNEVVSIALKNAKGEYSASVCGDFGNYRCDCSGFVSFVWKLGPDGPDTAEFPNYCDRITTKELKPGDAVLKPGTHVFMFIKWTDEANLMFEQAACHDEQEGCRNHEDDRRPSYDILY